MILVVVGSNIVVDLEVKCFGFSFNLVFWVYDLCGK